jgi:DNA-binding NarL/FixJ family response regulator
MALALAKSVLIVDDYAVIRRGLCELFTSEADFVVCGEAPNGREAIDKALELHPDLIVMDLAMPVMNGLEAARVLRRLMPNVPIIMFSDYAGEFAGEEARSAGISALIPKSENVSVLLKTARAFVRYQAAA